MNLIPKICEMLGVEIGEKFYIGREEKIEGAYYYFSNTELLYHVPNRTPDYAQYRELADLIYGDKTIIKTPFEPKVGERYWVVTWDSTLPYISACYVIWLNRADCFAEKYCGNCFRTKAEAEKHKYEIYEKLTGKKWEEVAE